MAREKAGVCKVFVRDDPCVLRGLQESLQKGEKEVLTGGWGGGRSPSVEAISRETKPRLRRPNEFCENRIGSRKQQLHIAVWKLPRPFRLGFTTFHTNVWYTYRVVETANAS